MNASFKNQPANQNTAQPTRFRMIFSRLPNVTFWCQSVIIPGVSTGYAPSPTPFLDQKLPGDKLVYESLMVTALVDEDLRVYREVHDWMRGFTFPTDFSEYRNLGKQVKTSNVDNKRPQYSDLSIEVFNSTWQHIYSWKFFDAFPVQIGQLAYSSADSADTTMVIDMTFEYQWFDIIPKQTQLA